MCIFPFLVSSSEQVGDGDLEAKVVVHLAVHLDRVDRPVELQEFEHALGREDVLVVRGEGDVASGWQLNRKQFGLSISLNKKFQLWLQTPHAKNMFKYGQLRQDMTEN